MMETDNKQQKQILCQKVLPDAILSDTDVMAIRALNCLKNHDSCSG